MAWPGPASLTGTLVQYMGRERCRPGPPTGVLHPRPPTTGGSRCRPAFLAQLGIHPIRSPSPGRPGVGQLYRYHSSPEPSTDCCDSTVDACVEPPTQSDSETRITCPDFCCGYRSCAETAVDLLTIHTIYHHHSARTCFCCPTSSWGFSL